MKAMILAAGRGERLKPLTDRIPKPLLKVDGERLIERHIQCLANNGITDIVINVHHLAELIWQTIGDGSQWGVNIQYSDETDLLRDTGGGIAHALALLGAKPFLVINSDVLSDFPLTPRTLDNGKHAHLIMVNNPEHNPQGDFYLSNNQLIPHGDQSDRLTYSGIGYYHPKIFHNRPECFRLADVIREQIDLHQVTASHYQGLWLDVGSPQRLHNACRVMADKSESATD